MKVQKVWVRHAHLSPALPTEADGSLAKEQRLLRQEILELLLRKRFVHFVQHPNLVFDNKLNAIWWLQGIPVASGQIYQQLSRLAVHTFNHWELPTTEELLSIRQEPLVARNPLFQNRPLYATSVDHTQLNEQIVSVGERPFHAGMAADESPIEGMVIPIHRISQRSIFEFIVAHVLFPAGIAGVQNKLSALYKLTLALHKQRPGAAAAPSLPSVQQYLLEGDYVRARLPVLEESYLHDTQKGLWELYQPKPPLGKDWLMIPLPEAWEARNPERDVRKGAVAIDFGTSSTVVACREQGKTTLLRVGITDFFCKPKAEDYQNPTIMEWIHLPNILDAWNAEAYRPMVRWDDFHFSHAALASYRQNEADQRIVASILTAIKQIPLLNDGRDYSLRITDQKSGADIELGTVMPQMPVHGQRISVSVNDPLDPIELYAYYLGLFINSRSNGLFLEYYMTFPVTYPKKVKRRILASFARGLMRSLPQALMDSPHIQRFLVREEASEPTAYAACALGELKIQPTEAGTAFAVFDFGGGSTDFDFGLYRLPTATEEEQGYEHVIEHFGASGDIYLGGENLVHHMAFLTFVHNLDMCRELRVSFTAPPEAELFAGHEMFIDRSHTAQANTILLMAKVRHLWEKFQWSSPNGAAHPQPASGRRQTDIIGDILHQSILDADFTLDPSLSGFPEADNRLAIEMELLNRQREKVSATLVVDRNAINRFLVKRVGRGIYQFFVAMHQAFTRRGALPQEVHILQAGNASQASLVQAIFAMLLQQNMYRWRAPEGEGNDNPVMIAIRKTLPILDPLAGVRFMVHRPPVGDPNDLYRPTAKTGVAIGLLKLIPGESLLALHTASKRRQTPDKAIRGVVAETIQDAPFHYYVGRLKRGRFQPVLMQNDPYGEWRELGSPTRRAFTLVYSSSPRSVFGELERGVSELREKTVTFKSGTEKKRLFVQAVAPATVVICLADSVEQVTKHSVESLVHMVLELT
ncbi:MAG: hypothetical protein HQL90_01535 [Magnetococcales bacterium]|nr:hypothetical protein [Magnetococcales bacterium]